MGMLSSLGSSKQSQERFAGPASMGRSGRGWATRLPDAPALWSPRSSRRPDSRRPTVRGCSYVTCRLLVGRQSLSRSTIEIARSRSRLHLSKRWPPTSGSSQSAPCLAGSAIDWASATSVFGRYRRLDGVFIRVSRELKGAVVSCIVPPWYALWLAPFIARAARAPVVVDYVDPWRIEQTGTFKSRLAGWIAAHTEATGLRGVSGLLAVADPIIEDVRQRCTALRSAPAAAAPYGFEAADWTLAPDGAPSAAGAESRRCSDDLRRRDLGRTVARARRVP